MPSAFSPASARRLVPLNGEAIVARARAASTFPAARAIDAASIAETLHLMRHPLR